jgi:predicted lipid-binding transport protein (Tim44 family)
MKHYLRLMSFVAAIFLTSAIFPSASAQSQPAKSTPTPPAKQAEPQKNTGEKAKGAAAGAAIGAATGGSAAKGAVVGAGHSRREERRTERKNK